MRSRLLLTFLRLALGVASPAWPLAFARAAAEPTTWTDTGAGFRAGTLGNSGQNLHVNRHGALETIRRYDLDGNGWLDLLFNCTHDTYNALPATLVSAARNRALPATDLDVDGSARVLAADLNRDGFTDLVFMPNKQNVQQQRASLIIAWGGTDGWTTRRLTRQLPVNGVTSLAIADLNGDGWPDILTLNSEGWLFGQPRGRILRTYWGGPQGFLLTKFHDLGVPDALEVVAGAFGENGESQVAVLTSTGAIHLLAAGASDHAPNIARSIALPATDPRAKPQCLAVQAARGGDCLLIGTDAKVVFQVATGGPREVVKSIPAAPATHLALGRLDDDEWPDVVLTNLQLVFPSDPNAVPSATSVTILWGGAGSWSMAGSTAMTIPNAAATTVGDLDGDGHGDLLVAVFQGGQSTKAASQVFFGNGGRQLPGKGAAVSTEGATDVTLARVTAAAAPTAIFANSQRRTLDDAVPLRLYWGSAGGFSTSAIADLPNLSGYKSSAADLNCDGFVDLIVINGADVTEETAARAPYSGANIYWGGSDGTIRGPGPTRFDPARRQVLPEKHLGSINVADLNGDGFLDLVLGAFESAEKPDTDLVIYYGSAEGILLQNRQALRGPSRSIGCLIADFNRDGWLDISVGSYRTNQVLTYWGSPAGYRTANRTILPYPAPIDLEAADFNHDGWLDLIVASYEDPVARTHDTGSTIFWGRAGGWHQAHSQWLPGITPLGLAVADLDGDGWLDLVSPHYHGELSRERLPSYIFWGTARGFTPLNRTALTVDSASEVVIADFNRDGKLDLAFAAHSLDPGHVLESPIFFNDGRRFQSPAVQYLPAIGPHYMWVQDLGNIYHRRHEETFTSRVFAWSAAMREATIVAEATKPFGATVKLSVRSATDAGALGRADWRRVAADSAPLSAADRVLQYRLDLCSANADAYPVIRRVEVRLR